MPGAVRTRILESSPKEAVMADVMTAQKVAARTEDAVKVYGKGQTEVRALDGVTVGFASGRYTAVMGPSRPAGPSSATWT
jgi:hypothetical protein